MLGRLTSAAGRGYLIAVLATAAAILVRGALPTVLADALYLPFFLAIVAAAAWGGWRPALLATAASALAVEFLFAPIPGWEDPVQLGRLVIFLAGGVGIGLLASTMRAAELREKHALLRAVIEGVADAVFVKDAQGYYRMVNAPGARRLGRSVAEVLGRDDATLLGAERAAEIRRHDQQVMREGTRLSYEEICDWSGPPRAYLTTKAPHRDDKGRVVGVLGISRDITERKQAEEALRQLNAELEQRAATLAAETRHAYQLLHAIFEGTQDLMAAMDCNFRYIAFNQAYHELLQRTFGSDLQVGQAIAEVIVPPQEQQAVHDLWQRAIAGESFTVERELADHRFYQIRYCPIRDSDGQIIGAADFLRDITARRQTEEALRQARDELELRVAQRTAELEAISQALRESEERFRAFMDNSPTIAWSKDEQGRLIYWNRAFQQRFQARWPDWQGKTDEELWPAEIAQRFRQKDAVVFRSGQTVEGIDEIPDRQGGVSSWWNFRFPFQDATGRRYVGSVGVDITERLQAEAELRRLYAELEQRVQQRTAELAATNQELEAFTYSVSHDLRAPLRHVTGYIQLLEKHLGPVLDDTGRRYVRTITEAGRRMGNLIDDLLVLSRLGRVPLTEAVVPLGPLVEEVRQELAAEVADREVVWHIGPLPEVRGDPSLLRSVLTNLLGNALKFSRQRHPAHIEVGAQEDGGELICFVRDNGAGFDMRYVDQLFQPFQRLHRLEEFEGAGIGLASVRRILQRHGGRSWAEGAVDRGATFYFSLPLRKNPP